MKKIKTIAKKLGVKKIELYGDYIAKLPIDEINPKSKLVLVTAINPTASGEGKTTVSIGLADAMNLINKKTSLALREPSLGPVFGMKGGATGGGKSLIVPSQEIDLHFTGDFHAITSANNLLCALIDNHIYQGNELNIDINTIKFNRCLDSNDRFLRNIQIGLGGKLAGIPREEHFIITAASEIMAIMCLATSYDDLKTRLGDIFVAYTLDKKPVFARDLHAENAMATLLKNALKPNLVQTLGGTPAIVHCGPFANIAHGCNSILATQLSMTYSDYTITEAGFGADLGAEKFLDVKCRIANIEPNCIVIVATCKALKLHGGENKNELDKQNLNALEIGSANLLKHIDNMQKIYQKPVVVAINKFKSDTKEELQLLKNIVEKTGVKAVVCEVFSKGGKGTIDLANEVVKLCEEKSTLHYAYDLNDTIENKIRNIATKVYGAKGIVLSEKAQNSIKEINDLGFSNYPIIIAKTQYSLSDNKELINVPKDFNITIDDIELRNGSKFLVCIAGKMLLMPGLPKHPRALDF